jgi:hypothetical protein
MGNGEKVEDIIAAAVEARKGLVALDSFLQSEIDRIAFTAAKEDRELKQSELTTRTELRASQSEVREAVRELGFVTLERLDRAEEVKSLSHRMKMINEGLGDDLGRLKRIGEISDTVATVADTVAMVAAGVAAIALKFRP